MSDVWKGCGATTADAGKQSGMAGSLLSALSLLFAPKKGLLDPVSPDTRIGDVTFLTAEGEPLSLSALSGQTILLVNTASRCAFKNQLSELQSLYDDLAGRGFVVVGVPSNDFGNQEPCDDDFVHNLYRSELGITFPLTAKVSARGRNIHPFFRRAATVAGKHAVPRWNFYKYVIAPNGHLAAWFSTPISPTSARVCCVIEECLRRGTDLSGDHASRVIATEHAS